MTNDLTPEDEFPETDDLMIEDLKVDDLESNELTLNESEDLSPENQIADVEFEEFGEEPNDGENSKMLELEETVLSETAESLAENILEHRNSDLTIDGAKVTRIDTSCIEILLSAAKLWMADRSCLKISSISDDFAQALEMLGIDQSMLETGEY